MSGHAYCACLARHGVRHCLGRNEEGSMLPDTFTTACKISDPRQESCARSSLFWDRVCSSSVCSSWGSALKALVSSTLLSISFTAATNPHCHILLISH